MELEDTGIFSREKARDLHNGREPSGSGSPKALLNLPSRDTSLHHPWFHWFPCAESQRLQDEIKIKGRIESLLARLSRLLTKEL